MSADKKREGSAEEAEITEGGPGLAYMPFVVMEDLLDKLKLLNYEQEFVKGLRMRPLNRHYFVLPTNPGEQFFLLTSLSAWLIRRSGHKFEQPQESDDPNATLASILEYVRKLGISVDFAPSRLKQGYGEHAIFVLDRLADAALKFGKFAWQKPEIRVDEAENEMENEAQHEDEVDLERVEEQMALDISDDEDEAVHIDQLEAVARPAQVLDSTQDADAWRLEVERVAPMLKLVIGGDERDWRHHLAQMHTYRSSIDDALKETQTYLQRLQVEVNRNLEKISSREKYLNNQLESKLREFRQQSDNLTATKEQYRGVSSGVVERTRILAQLSDDLEAIRTEMEERGASMTDGSPLVNIKRALARMKGEQRVMDVRIGVLEHSLMQAQLRAKSNWHKEANRVNGGQDFFYV